MSSGFKFQVAILKDRPFPSDERSQCILRECVWECRDFWVWMCCSLDLNELIRRGVRYEVRGDEAFEISSEQSATKLKDIAVDERTEVVHVFLQWFGAKDWSAELQGS